MLPLGHIGKIQYACFSSDGSRVLSTAYDGEYDIQVLVWDLETREIIHVINTEQGIWVGEVTYVGLESALFSPSGKKIITVGAASTKFWDTETGNFLSEINDYEHFATCANGEMLIARSSMGDTTTIKIWDTETQEIVNELTGDFNIEGEIFFGCDTKSVIFVSNAKIYLWDFIENKVYETLMESERKENLRVVEANSKTLICSAHNDSHFEICYFTLPNLELVKSITYHNDYIYNYSLINKNKELLLYTQNEELNLFEAFIYDFQSGDLLLKTDSTLTRDSFYSFLIEKKYHINSVKLGQLLYYQLEINNTVYFNEERSLIFLPDVDGTNVYNVESGEFLYSISSEPSEAFDFVLNGCGNKFLTFNENSPSIEIRDVFSGRQIMSLTGRINPIKASRFDNQGKHLWIWDGLNTRLWDIENSKFVYSINFQKRVPTFSFSKNNLFVACRMPESIMVLDFYSGQLISEINLSISGFGTVAFSDDGSRIVTSDGESVVKLWDTTTGKLLSEYGTMGLYFFNAEFSPDSKFIVATSSDLKTKKRKKRKNQEEDEVFKQYFFDISNGKMKGSVVGGVVNFDSGNEWIITQNYGQFDLHDYYLLWDLKTYKFIDTINFSGDSTSLWRLISSQLLSDREFDYFEKYDGKSRVKGEILSINRSQNLVVTSLNNILYFYSLSPDTLLYSMVLANQTDYLILHPDGYFDGTDVSRNLVYFVCNGEIIDLAQMKDALYIPGLADIIIKGKTINYPTKLTDLGICDALPVVTKLQEEAYSYSITPRRLPLERVEVYINDKVIFNFLTSQLSFDGTSYRLVLDDKDIDKHLFIGKENEVKIIGVVKELGSELRTRGIIIPAAKESKVGVVPPRLFAVMIGVNDYRDPSLKLNYPAKDAMELGKAVETAAMKLLGKENVFMYPIYTGVKPGTGFTTPEKAGIKRALEDIGKKARPEDIVFMFFAGHGEMQGADGKLFTFLTADASKFNPIGISTKELQDWLSYEGPHKMLANKTILIFDACNSGQATMELLASARNDDNTDRIRQVEDLKDKSGTFILAGSAPNQAAYELPQYQQGMLTYSLLSVLKNNPAILDDQQFLNVQKWFLESEQKLKEEVESKGLKQEAKPFGTANIRIGIVDEEVRSTINLANERAVIYCENIIEFESVNDLLKLKELLSKEFSALSARGSASSVFFITAATKQANRLNISYLIQEDKIVAHIRLDKGEDILLRTTLTGLKSDLDGLVKEITEAVVRAAK